MKEEDQENKTIREDRPRIYVASLADYNSGCLHGVWIDADQPTDDINGIVQDMLKKSREPIAEEWAIHDYENFGSLRLSEFEDLEKVSEVACLINEHGHLFAELVGHFGGVSNVDEAKRYMEEGYRGAFESLSDYAGDLVEECYGDVLSKLPDFIRYNIDFDAIGRDMELGGDIFTLYHDHKVHVFDALI